jgi:hypothetical protein
MVRPERHMSRLLVIALLLIAATTSAIAVPPPPPLVTPSTASITLHERHVGGNLHVTVDLVAKEIVERDPAKPATVRQRRKLEADEVAALVKAWAVVWNAERVDPSKGPPPGGSWHYEVIDARGASKLVSYENGVPAGRHYIAIDVETAEALSRAWPGVAAKKVPPTLERRVREFLTEAIFGPPGSARNLAKSWDRLDPAHTQFEMREVTAKSDAFALVLEPRSPAALRVGELAKELEVARPIAMLRDGEWVLGDAATGRAVSAWRGAEVAIVLDVPRGATGSQQPIDKASVKRIKLRQSK